MSPLRHQGYTVSYPPNSLCLCPRSLAGALMSRPRGALRGEWRSGRSRAAGHPLPAPAPRAVAHLPEAEASPRLEAAARALAAGGRSGPGGAGQVSAARPGPGVEGEGCIVTRAAAR